MECFQEWAFKNSARWRLEKPGVKELLDPGLGQTFSVLVECPDHPERQMWELRGCCAPRFVFSSKTGSASSCQDGLLRLPPSLDVCLPLPPWEITSNLADSHSHQKARKKQMQSYKRGSNNHGRKQTKITVFPFFFQPSRNSVQNSWLENAVLKKWQQIAFAK